MPLLFNLFNRNRNNNQNPNNNRNNPNHNNNRNNPNHNNNRNNPNHNNNRNNPNHNNRNNPNHNNNRNNPNHNNNRNNPNHNNRNNPNHNNNRNLSNFNTPNNSNFNNQSQFNMQNNLETNLPTQQLQGNLNNGINFKPITPEDMEKLQKEIQENIKLVNEKNQISNLNEISKGAEVFIPNISEFLQDEKNSSMFYKSLSEKFENKNHIRTMEKISNDCSYQIDCLKKIYLEKNNDEYKFKEPSINTNILAKDGLVLAINEELKSYEKICETLDKNVDLNIKNHFNKMALNKLKRITSLQFILVQYM